MTSYPASLNLSTGLPSTITTSNSHLHHKSLFLLKSIGTYPSFTATQTAAFHSFNTALAGYERAGVRGNVAKTINLVLRGLITGIIKDSIKLPISEFEIRPVFVCDQSWTPQWGDECERALMQSIDKERETEPRVKLPSATATTMSKEESKNTRSEHRPEEELNPHWAQSVIPHWSRRSEFPPPLGR
jgi:hypothetical protein